MTEPPSHELRELVKMYTGWNERGDDYDRTDELVDYAKTHGESMARALLECRELIGKRARQQKENPSTTEEARR